jgi:hypothetical protein
MYRCFRFSDHVQPAEPVVLEVLGVLVALSTMLLLLALSDAIGTELLGESIEVEAGHHAIGTGLLAASDKAEFLQVVHVTADRAAAVVRRLLQKCNRACAGGYGSIRLLAVLPERLVSPDIVGRCRRVGTSVTPPPLLLLRADT